MSHMVAEHHYDATTAGRRKRSEKEHNEMTIDQKERTKATDTREYIIVLETELQRIYAGILALMDKSKTIDVSMVSSEVSQKSCCDEKMSQANEKEDLEVNVAKHSSKLETTVARSIVLDDEITTLQQQLQCIDKMIDVPAVPVMQIPCVCVEEEMIEIPVMMQRQNHMVQTVQMPMETPQLHIIEKATETTETQTIQDTQTSESLCTAPVCQVAQTRAVKVVKIETPLHAESASPMFVSTPVSRDRVQQRTVEQIVDAPDPQTVEELNEASKIFSQNRAQQRFEEQIVEPRAVSLAEKIDEVPEEGIANPAISLAEMIIEAPVIQMPGMTQQIVNTYVQHVINTVEAEKPKIIDETVQKPTIQEKINQVIKHVEIPQVQVVADTAEIPQVQFINKVDEIPVETQRQERRLNCTVENVRRESARVLNNTGAERVKFTHEGPHDDDDGDHGRTDGQTDQDKRSRHMDSPIRDVSKQARRQDGGQNGRDDKTENKKVYVREQGKTTERTIEELRKAIISNEVYFVHNGRVLTASEVNGLKHNVIIHAVRRMQGGGKKKAKKSQDTELSSSETDTLAAGVMNQTDPDLMGKLADMSEEETENVLKAIEQSISKDASRLTRSGAERVLNEIKKVALERKKRQETEKQEGQRGGEDVEDNQWDDMLGFGRYYGKTYRDVYRDDQQYCEWIKTQESQNKGLTKFQNFLQRVEEKSRENVRKELEKREKRIQLNEMHRAAAASSGEPKTNDAIARHLVAAEREATARREAAARNETMMEKRAQETREEECEEQKRAQEERERLARERAKAEREAAMRDEVAAKQIAAARQAAAEFEEAAKHEEAAGDEAAAERESAKAAKQETEARHETAMNEIGRSMREHTTRHETMAEEKAIEWRKREQEWAGIWNRQRWNHMKWHQQRRQGTTGDVRRIRTEEIQIRRQESERNPPGLNDPPDAGQQRVGEEIQVDDEDDKKWELEARVREIDTRLRRVEERIYDEGVSGQALAQGGQDIDEDNEQWQKWRGKWWMRIDRTELSSRQRRKISRVVKRMITRETNDFDQLVNDLKQSIADMRESAEIQKATRYYYMSSGEDGLTRPHGHDMMGRDDDDYSW